MVASAATKFVGSIAQGQIAGAEADAAANGAAANARATRQQSAANEDTQRRLKAVRLGQQRAAAAQSGFDPSSGSLLELQGKSAGQLELDVLTQRYENDLRALSFDNEQTSLLSRAKSSRRTGWMSAFGSLSEAAGTYFGAPRIGPPAPVETRNI